MDFNLNIPHKEKHRFSQPLGKLISGTRKQTIPQVEEIINTYKKLGYQINCYLVGDVVTQDFLSNDFLISFIRLCIVDEKTQRNHIKIEFEEFFEEIIEFENPEGGIQKKSFNLLKNIIASQKRTLLKITKGEEDLLVLPLVISLSIIENIKNIVLYGQPPVTNSRKPIPEGIVLVDVNTKIQKAVKKFLSLMEKV